MRENNVTAIDAQPSESGGDHVPGDHLATSHATFLPESASNSSVQAARTQRYQARILPGRLSGCASDLKNVTSERTPSFSSDRCRRSVSLEGTRSSFIPWESSTRVLAATAPGGRLRSSYRAPPPVRAPASRTHSPPTPPLPPPRPT